MKLRILSLLVIAIFVMAFTASAQPTEPKQKVRTVTIPISIFTKNELRGNQVEEYVQADRLIVRENKDEQQVLSIRSVSSSPLSIAILIQEDLSSNFNLQISDIKDFIRALPKGTRVLVAYLRSGTIDVRQRFTEDLTLAAKSLRIVSGSSTLAPRSPYDGVAEVIGRFEALPAGRRAILLFSDGLDTSQGGSVASMSQSSDLERSILKAQRKSVAVYSFYSPTRATESGDSILTLASQSALSRLSEETGGRDFSHGTITPLNYLPFFKELTLSLSRQFSLTYLSTHMKKGYYKVEVMSTNPEVKIEHPKGYYFR